MQPFLNISKTQTGATEWVLLAEKVLYDESAQVAEPLSPLAEKLLTLLMTKLMAGVGYGAEALAFQLDATLKELFAVAEQLRQVTVGVENGMETLTLR